MTMAICLAVYLVTTGAVQAQLNPTGVLKTRLIIPFAVPVLGLIVLGLVLLDQVVPTLHRAVDEPSTPSLA